MAKGWYGTQDNLGERLRLLYEKLEEEGDIDGQDDFLLAMESAEHQPGVLDGKYWRYPKLETDKPITKLEISEEVPRGEREVI